MPDSGPLLAVNELTVHYRRGLRTPPLVAVDGVSFDLGRGETVALVGESGSGKSSIGSAVLGLTRPAGGRIHFQGTDLTGLRPRARHAAVQGALQAVYQDPYSSLNPARRLGRSLLEPVVADRSLTGRQRVERVDTLLRRVGLRPDMTDAYPAELSGGQLQRVAIARALMSSPALVVCDEPVSALDVSLQGQVLNLLNELQADLGLSYLFISHDLSVVRHMAARTIVLYQGRVMEAGPTAQVCTTPAHPYTRALLAAAPSLGTRRRPAGTSAGSIDHPPVGAGCPFSTRCPDAIDICHTVTPEPRLVDTGVQAACHRASPRSEGEPTCPTEDAKRPADDPGAGTRQPRSPSAG